MTWVGGEVAPHPKLWINNPGTALHNWLIIPAKYWSAFTPYSPRLLPATGLEITTKICFSFGKACLKFTFPNIETLFRINSCHWKFCHCLICPQIQMAFINAFILLNQSLFKFWKSVQYNWLYGTFPSEELTWNLLFHLNFYLSRKSGKSVNSSPVLPQLYFNFWH